MLNWGWQTDRTDRAAERSSRRLEFNDLNIHLYLRLNYGTAPEHLKYSVCEHFMVLYDVFVASLGLNNNTEIISLKAQDRIWIWSDRYRSTENDWFGADTDPQYRIDASLILTSSVGEAGSRNNGGLFTDHSGRSCDKTPVSIKQSWAGPGSMWHHTDRHLRSAWY